MEPKDNTIDILSEDCFRLIFSCLTLQEQLSLRLVSTQWNSLVCSIFTSVRTLKVFGCDEDLEHLVTGMKNYRVKDTYEVQEILGTNIQRSVDDFNHDAFMVKKDEQSAKIACTVLSQLFPNVQYLVLACRQLYSSDQLPKTLNNWSHSLVSVLFLKMPPNLPTHFWPSLSTCTKINRLHFIHSYHNSIPTSLLSHFFNLKHFFLTHYLYDIVQILGSLHFVENIKMAMVILSVEQLQRVIELNPRIVKQLKCLSLGTISSTPNVNRYTNFKHLLDFFCTRFKNINYIDILFADQLPLVEIISVLSKLPTLTELWIYLGPTQLPTKINNISSFPQLNTVSTLYIEIYDITIKQFCVIISILFPNLRELTVKVDPDFNKKELLKKLSDKFVQLTNDKIKIIDN